MPFTADPNDRKDYTIDWSGDAPGPRLAAGETISTSTWTVPDGITEVDDPAPSKTDTTTTIYLTGGTAGEHYTITNHVVTSQSREYDWSFVVQIADR